MKSNLFILVRHAESDFNGQARIQGHLDSSLTPKGLKQAGHVARYLKKFNIRKVYSSDLGRAYSTTQVITRALKKNIIKDKGLREINLGHWEGLTPHEVNARYKNGYIEWRQSPSRKVIPGAERVRHFHKRVRNTVKRIMQREKKGVVLIVTHGGVIASLVADWLKADFDRVILDLRLDNTGLTFVEQTPKGFILHAVNEITHLGKDKPRADIFTKHR